MRKSCVALLLLSSLAGCSEDEGDEGASLFGDGGPPSMPELTGGEATDGTTGTDSADDAPPPPPPPPPPGDDDGTTGDPMPGTDTGGDTTGSAEESSSDEGNDTFNDGTLDVEVINQSMFPQGQCDDVIVTNVSAMSVTWEIELPLPGMIDMSWNCNIVEAGGMGTFTGVDFNATLDPGAQAMFGYCVLY